MIFFVTFAIIGAAMALMAVGLLANRQLRGSCGGSADCRCADTASCPRFKARRRQQPRP
jgi:hypothetical protein